MNPPWDLLLTTILLVSPPSAADTPASLDARMLAGDARAVIDTAPGFPGAGVDPADRWVAEDKFKHATLSFAVTAFSQAAIRSTGVPTGTAVPIGAAIAALAGIGKEVHDRRNGGTFSARDLAWDALGIIAGVMVTSQAR